MVQEQQDQEQLPLNQIQAQSAHYCRSRVELAIPIIGTKHRGSCYAGFVNLVKIVALENSA